MSESLVKKRYSEDECKVIRISEVLCDPSDNVSRSGKKQSATDPSITRLSADIQTNGLLEPICVRPLDPPLPIPGVNGSYSYRVVFGFRRIEALKHIQEETVLCIIRNYTEEEAHAANISENTDRENPSDYDIGLSLTKLKRKTGKSNRDIAVSHGLLERDVRDVVGIFENCPSECIEYYRHDSSDETRRVLVKISRISMRTTEETEQAQIEEFQAFLQAKQETEEEKQAILDAEAHGIITNRKPKTAESRLNQSKRSASTNTKSLRGYHLYNYMQSVSHAREWYDGNKWISLSADQKSFADSVLEYVRDPAAVKCPVR